MEDLDLGLKIPACITFTILEKVLMVMGDVEIGLRPAPLPHMIQVGLLDHWVYLDMVIIEVDICLRPATLLHIAMVDYTFPTQVCLKKLLQGVFQEKYPKQS